MRPTVKSYFFTTTYTTMTHTRQMLSRYKTKKIDYGKAEGYANDDYSFMFSDELPYKKRERKKSNKREYMKEYVSRGTKNRCSE